MNRMVILRKPAAAVPPADAPPAADEVLAELRLQTLYLRRMCRWLLFVAVVWPAVAAAVWFLRTLGAAVSASR